MEALWLAEAVWLVVWLVVWFGGVVWWCGLVVWFGGLEQSKSKNPKMGSTLGNIIVFSKPGKH